MKASLAITLQQWAKKKIHRALLWTAVVIDAIIRRPLLSLSVPTH
jgi:hypothetical protein